MKGIFRKRSRVLFGAFACMLLIGLIWFLPAYLTKVKIKNKIMYALEHATIQKYNFVRFDQVYPDFDSLMIINPYFDVSRGEKLLKIDLSEIRSTNIGMRDDISVFAFFKNRVLVQYTTINRRFLFEGNSFRMYSRDHLFKLETDIPAYRNHYVVNE